MSARDSGVAFLFPGQGATRVHDALRSTVRRDGGRARCEIAARAADVPLARLLERPSLLDRTEVLQPVLTAIALAAAGVLAEAGIRPAIVAGHSLGELAAWAVAGGVGEEEVIRLAAFRGRWMAREAAARPGGMVALATAEAGVIEAALEAGSRCGAICLAARNAPDETVLSGDEAAVRAVLAFAPEIATRVPTAGAWHSPAMAGAVEEWRAALTAARASAGAPLTARLVANRHGEVVGGADDVPDLLAEQLIRPIEWRRTLATLASFSDPRGRAGVSAGQAVVTLGPGAVLRALWHRNQRVTADAHPQSEAGRKGQPSRVQGAAAVPPTLLLATDDDRSLAETIATLRGAS